MTSGQSESTIKQVEAFLDKHLHKKARFKSTVTYLLPGFPPKETALVLDKDDYIENIKEGIHALRDHHSEITVKSVHIVSNGQQAIVMTEGRESGTMAIPVQGEPDEKVPIEGFTNCNQILRLSKKGVIQMYNAVCDTQIEFIGAL